MNKERDRREANAAERMIDWTRQHEPVRLDPATFRSLAFEALEEAENELVRASACTSCEKTKAVIESVLNDPRSFVKELETRAKLRAALDETEGDE